MAKIKERKADLIVKYRITIEIAVIFSLLIIIAAFKFFPDLKEKKEFIEAPQELVTIEDIAQSVQDQPPPPPPQKPSIIIEAPADEILEDIEIESTELDLEEQVAPPPPPPAKEKVKVEEEPQFFVAVEQMPEPIGGIKAIHDKIKYPEIAKRAGVEGLVYILAYLNEEGKVVKTEVIKGIGAGCDEEAALAVKQTRFIPGKQRGKPVKVKVMIPVRFRLEDKRPI